MLLDLPYRKNIRLKNYDYSQQGAYFVTICVQGRECLFGKVVDGNVVLNDVGKLVDVWWKKIVDKYPTVQLGTYVIMPNHFHGIIDIVGAGFPRPSPIERPRIDGKCSRIGGCMQTGGYSQTSREIAGTGGGTPPLRQEPTLGQIFGFFKYQTTKSINELQKTPGDVIWQRGYYEHVIRNDDDYERISEYIIFNPENWVTDEENPMNIKNPPKRST